VKQKDPIKNFLKINKSKDWSVSYSEVVEIINSVAKIHRSKKFGFMTEDDIESQVKLICLQQLKFYEKSKETDRNPKKNLEKWLNKIAKNRLKNFYRDNCSSVNKKHAESRKRLASSANSFEETNCSFDKNAVVNSNIYNTVEYEELQKFVMERLDPIYQEIFKACLSNEAVTSYYRNKLEFRIKEILLEWNNNE
jgi:hypothetical protein